MSNTSETVVIVGAGYAGAALAVELQDHADVVLVDPRDAFVNVAASLRALVRPDWAPNMFFPLEKILRRGRLVRDRVVSVDPGGVTLTDGARIEADHLVLATGSRYPYPANPSVALTADALADLRRTHAALSDAREVLIVGGGPVGLELAGEIVDVWPHTQVTIVEPRSELLPGFLSEVRVDLRRQLDELGVQVLLGAQVNEYPAVEPAELGNVTMTLGDGRKLEADIWFRAFGVTLDTDYLADGKLVAPTATGAVPVTDTMNVIGHERVYAIGDIADVGEAKMAGFAGQHAAVVAKNILADLRGDSTREPYTPLGVPTILLPLGVTGGVGQLPSPDGPTPVTADTVSQYKGQDIFTARFAEQFGVESGG